MFQYLSRYKTVRIKIYKTLATMSIFCTGIKSVNKLRQNKNINEGMAN